MGLLIQENLLICIKGKHDRLLRVVFSSQAGWSPHKVDETVAAIVLDRENSIRSKNEEKNEATANDSLVSTFS